jgi:3-deoxy-D-manno-octulosonic-acid transferase
MLLVYEDMSVFLLFSVLLLANGLSMCLLVTENVWVGYRGEKQPSSIPSLRISARLSLSSMTTFRDRSAIAQMCRVRCLEE